jgi:organic radical activating enzyme
MGGEKQDMRKPIEIINNDYSDYLHLEYSLTNVCNYKCWYCGPELNSGTIRFPENFDLLVKNLDHVLSVYREHHGKKRIRINLIGGEPTLWPKISDFAKHYYEQDVKITMATNGSRTARWFRENANFFDDIHVSIHHEFCDPDHIIEIMDVMYNETDVLGNASILMDVNHWDKCVAIVDKLVAHPTPWVFKIKPIFVNGQMDQYTQEQLDYIRTKLRKQPPQEYIDKQIAFGRIPVNKPNIQVKFDDGTTDGYKTFDLFENDWYHFTGWRCNVGVDRLGINGKHDIVGFCGQDNIYGLASPLSMFDPELPSKFTPDLVRPTICEQVSCTCPSDTKVSKIKFYDR